MLREGGPFQNCLNSGHGIRPCNVFRYYLCRGYDNEAAAAKAEKEFKNVIAYAKAYNKYLPATIESYMQAHGYTAEQMFEHFVRNHGSLN
jgi:hypothetical protein